MGGRRTLAGLCLGAALACAPKTSFFVCESNAQCVDGDAMGFCDVELGVCSFTDHECASMRRYGSLAGPLSGECVPLEDGSSGGESATSSPGTSVGNDPTLDSTSSSTTDPETTDPTTPISATDPTDPTTTGGGLDSTGGESTGAPTTTGTTTTQTMSFGEGDGTDVGGVTEDNFIDAGSPENNAGAHGDFHIENDRTAVSLLRFDVSALPDGANIVDVELDLYSGGPDIDCLVNLYVMLEDWSEGSEGSAPGVSNWTERTASSSWSSPGAGSGSHDPAAVGSIDHPAADTPYTVEIDPGVVQSWLQSPNENYGLLLASDDSNTCYGWFMSAEAGDPDLRPRLRVEFE